MYYILTSELENYKEDAILEGYSDYMERIECSFQDGLPLPVEDIETPILFQFYEFASRGTMTDHLNLKDIPGPVFSEKVKTIFVKNGFNNIQYFRLTLLDKFPLGKIEDDAKKAVEYTNYYIANIVGLVDCVSHEKSKLEYFYPPELRNQFEETTMDETNNPFAGENTNDIDIITKLVLDESKIDSTLKIFRLKDQPH